MPLVRVSYITDSIPADTIKKMAEEIREVIMSNVPAPSEVVWVMFDEVKGENWMIHGTMLDDQDPPEIFGKS